MSRNSPFSPLARSSWNDLPVRSDQSHPYIVSEQFTRVARRKNRKDHHRSLARRMLPIGSDGDWLQYLTVFNAAATSFSTLGKT